MIRPRAHLPPKRKRLAEMRRGGLTVVLVGGHKPAVAMGDGGPDGIFPGRSAKVVLERRLGTRYVALL